MVCQYSSTENYNLFKNVGRKKKDFKCVVTCIWLELVNNDFYDFVEF